MFAVLCAIMLLLAQSGMEDLTSLLGSGLTVNVYGPDITTLTELSEKVVELVNSTEGFEDATNGLGEGGRVISSYPELSDTVKLCAMFDTLRACAELAEASGIQMNLEPLNTTTDHAGNFLTTTRTAAELTRLIGSPRLKVLYDVYHMQLNEGSLCDNIRAYGDQFGHIHVADAPGRHEPGTGEIRFSAVLRCLEEIGYAGLIGFELFPAASTAQAVRAIRAL